MIEELEGQRQDSTKRHDRRRRSRLSRHRWVKEERAIRAVERQLRGRAASVWLPSDKLLRALATKKDGGSASLFGVDSTTWPPPGSLVPAWALLRPSTAGFLFSPRYVRYVFLLLSIVSLIIGVVLWYSSRDVFVAAASYDDSADEVLLKVPASNGVTEFRPPLYVHYTLNGFYQNVKGYISSRPEILFGNGYSCRLASTCRDAELLRPGYLPFCNPDSLDVPPEKVLFMPCGLPSLFAFDDSFRVYVRRPIQDNVSLPLGDSSGVSLPLGDSSGVSLPLGDSSGVSAIELVAHPSESGAEPFKKDGVDTETVAYLPSAGRRLNTSPVAWGNSKRDILRKNKQKGVAPINRSDELDRRNSATGGGAPLDRRKVSGSFSQDLLWRSQAPKPNLRAASPHRFSNDDKHPVQKTTDPVFPPLMDTTVPSGKDASGQQAGNTTSSTLRVADDRSSPSTQRCGEIPAEWHEIQLDRSVSTLWLPQEVERNERAVIKLARMADSLGQGDVYRDALHRLGSDGISNNITEIRNSGNFFSKLSRFFPGMSDVDVWLKTRQADGTKVKMWLPSGEIVDWLGWLRPSVSPNFWKLWGVVNEAVRPGDEIRIKIEANRFPSSAFHAKKGVVLSNTSLFGGHQTQSVVFCFLVAALYAAGAFVL